MEKNRTEAFSDGLFAIIITVMVLEIKAPHGGINALPAILPSLGSYALSFVMLGIYWNNHHHLFMAAECVNGRVLWANLHLIFWLSLIPFTTAWMGENGLAPAPIAVYGALLFLSAIAYYILTRTLVAQHGIKSKLAKAIGGDSKGVASLVLYAIAIGAAFYQPLISLGVYVVVAMMWLIPDRRIERALGVKDCD